jgi:hypothetical protein
VRIQVGVIDKGLRPAIEVIKDKDLSITFL